MDRDNEKMNKMIIYENSIWYILLPQQNATLGICINWGSGFASFFFLAGGPISNAITPLGNSEMLAVDCKLNNEIITFL